LFNFGATPHFGIYFSIITAITCKQAIIGILPVLRSKKRSGTTH